MWNTIIFNVVSAAPSPPKIMKSVELRLYTLNCGYFKVHDAASFFNRNFYPHQTLLLAGPCFLIKHDKTWMLLDLGLGDQYVGNPVEDTKNGITIIVPIRLTTQLKKLGLSPADIKYVALSHAHFDHTGNPNLFPHATWIVQRGEYQFILRSPLSSAIDINFVKLLKGNHKILINGDYNVFSDGTVKVISTPGHTQGMNR